LDDGATEHGGEEDDEEDGEEEEEEDEDEDEEDEEDEDYGDEEEEEEGEDSGGNFAASEEARDIERAFAASTGAPAGAGAGAEPLAAAASSVRAMLEKRSKGFPPARRAAGAAADGGPAPSDETRAAPAASSALALAGPAARGGGGAGESALVLAGGPASGKGGGGGGGGGKQRGEDAFFDDPLRLPFSSATLMEADDEACLQRLQGIVRMGCPVDVERDLKTLLYCVASGKPRCVAFLMSEGVHFEGSDAPMRVAALAARHAIETSANVDSKRAREELAWRVQAGLQLLARGCPLVAAPPAALVAECAGDRNS